jgi:riboflavin kinase/FMN adenylyltransferase
VLVGDDFRFGHRGAGNADTLEAAGRSLGFGVSRMETLSLGGQRISSSRVREALNTGELDLARSLLGWAYAVCGRVRVGQRLGRTIGFPTANIACGRNRFPVSGVFAVRVRDGSRRFGGVANVGHRPTVGGLEERLEVHLFDLDEDLYGRELEVEFVARIRGEKKFEGLDALRRQIAADAEAARARLEASGPEQGA